VFSATARSAKVDRTSHPFTLRLHAEYNTMLFFSHRFPSPFFRYLLQRLSSLNMKRSDWPPQIAL